VCSAVILLKTKKEIQEGLSGIGTSENNLFPIAAKIIFRLSTKLSTKKPAE
jgi:hypothetical protein